MVVDLTLATAVGCAVFAANGARDPGLARLNHCVGNEIREDLSNAVTAVGCDGPAANGAVRSQQPRRAVCVRRARLPSFKEMAAVLASAVEFEWLRGRRGGLLKNS